MNRTISNYRRGCIAVVTAVFGFVSANCCQCGGDDAVNRSLAPTKHEDLQENSSTLVERLGPAAIEDAKQDLPLLFEMESFVTEGDTGTTFHGIRVGTTIDQSGTPEYKIVKLEIPLAGYRLDIHSPGQIVLKSWTASSGAIDRETAAKLWRCVTSNGMLVWPSVISGMSHSTSEMEAIWKFRWLDIAQRQERSIFIDSYDLRPANDDLDRYRGPFRELEALLKNVTIEHQEALTRMDLAEVLMGAYAVETRPEIKAHLVDALMGLGLKADFALKDPSPFVRGSFIRSASIHRQCSQFSKYLWALLDASELTRFEAIMAIDGGMTGSCV